jgi:hypothetical protein
MREECSVRQVNVTISLAFLAPNFVKATVEGRPSRGIGVERLHDPPTDWTGYERRIFLAQSGAQVKSSQPGESLRLRTA